MLCGFFCRGARALWAGEDSFDILPVDNPRSAHIHAHTWLYIFNVDINQPRSCVTPCVLYVWFTLSILWCCVCACVCFVSYSLWSVRAMLSWLITLKHTHESCTNNNNNNKKHRTRPYFLSHAFHTHTQKEAERFSSYQQTRGKSHFEIVDCSICQSLCAVWSRGNTNLLQLSVLIYLYTRIHILLNTLTHSHTLIHLDSITQRALTPAIEPWTLNIAAERIDVETSCFSLISAHSSSVEMHEMRYPINTIRFLCII